MNELETSLRVGGFGAGGAENRKLFCFAGGGGEKVSKAWFAEAVAAGPRDEEML